MAVASFSRNERLGYFAWGKRSLARSTISLELSIPRANPSGTIRAIWAVISPSPDPMARTPSLSFRSSLERSSRAHHCWLDELAAYSCAFHWYIGYPQLCDQLPMG
jgi:hypothetical protein